MAERGASAEQILAKYFPGTNVGSALRSHGVALARPGDNGSPLWPLPAANTDRGYCLAAHQRPRTFADLLWNPEQLSVTESGVAAAVPYPGKRATLSSEHFRVSYPEATPQRDVAGILQTLEATRADLLRQISSAGLGPNQFPLLGIFINDTTGNFVGRTGQPWWAAAATKGNQIELQPTAVLQRRGVLTTTLRHELTHVAIEAVSHGRAPRWLAEGMALHIAGEGPMISRYTPRAKMTVAEIDAKLSQTSSADQMRAAYAAAYDEVRRLAKEDGDRSLWQRIATAGR